MKSEVGGEKDTQFMSAALEMAEVALAQGDFPVGCVVAGGSVIVARARRTGTADGPTNEIDHAEINTLRSLYADAPDVDRTQLTLYCTMEPCLMCFAAILLSGIGRVVYAYEDVMGGGTGCDRSGLPPLYRDAQITVISGVMRNESLVLFQRFFAGSGNAYWADSLLSRYTLDQAVAP
ncbi:nucleoside deaminase [Desulfosarcina ovata]|uniref:tRNA-specific adenosine deaminase n=1 Tax=Desulfosarcina ovata subsp. ovata TaxID=2752305 RepID=A0A5K8AHB6_9BACT|nr:nucleoside deaminase [Desulfosarcina ovata]BBO91889.1 tRNA-specific adenosine deaminase [Desulfosarcina ovata subsp. ovata]